VQPLDGITVVSLEHAIAAPLATRHLADLGARVIKVERPDGGDFARGYDERVRGLASHFVWCNRSKESVTIDLKTDLGLEALRRLVSRADVLVQNLAPGAAERIGCSFERLAPQHPQLIVCDISGYGQTGPQRNRKAYDLLIQSEAGFLSVTGSPGSVAKAGCSIADIAAGMYAYSGILAALIERTRTGRGTHIDVSMLEAMTEWMGFPLYYSFDGAPQPDRTGAAHATIYPYGPFRTMDGEIMFGIQNEREWAAFCALLLEQPALANDTRFTPNSARSANRAILHPIIESKIGILSTDAARTLLDEAGIANTMVNDMAALWRHPQLAARQRWRQVETPQGTIPALVPPGLFDAQFGPVPAAGEHTISIMAEIGLAEDVAERKGFELGLS